MLISYPVLPARQADESEETYFERILETHVLADEGRYPVSTLMTKAGALHRWHGGLHLHGGAEPIRAIADGVVVAFRVARGREEYEGLGEYDTGFVLLRHETETGDNTRVRFYSLYMHLACGRGLSPERFAQLPPWWRQAIPGPVVQTPSNLRVWRKDVIGFAGQLYGRETCHFEVFATEADLAEFWRDSATVTKGAGSPDFFGHAHFVVPPGRPFKDRHPRAAAAGPHRIDFPGAQDFPLEVGQSGHNAETLYVSVRLEQGQRITTTYRAIAGGRYEQVGMPVVQKGYEYELYRLATALYPDCPSAGLEWIRFGRLLSRDTTTRSENWQLIRYAEGAVGYIDLAPDTVAKLSDADFPHWHGWERRSEGEIAAAGDGVCDDAHTLAWVEGGDDAARLKLRHLVCKQPSEWDAKDLWHRYARLRQPGQPLDTPAARKKFEQHVQTLAFWGSLGMKERSVWFFHPLQFVHHYRRCGWMSLDEMTQMIPRRSTGAGLVPWADAQRRLESGIAPSGAMPPRLHPALNQALRKYIVLSPQRRAHFFAQVLQETGGLTADAENGNEAYFRRMYEVITPQEAETEYDRAVQRGRKLPNGRWPIEIAPAGARSAKITNKLTYVASRPKRVQEKAQELGNSDSGDGPRFKGRGLIQLTGRAGYLAYGRFRGRNYTAQPNEELLATEAQTAADVSGKYWINAAAFGGKNINRLADTGCSPSQVESVTRAVNGGTTHLDLRGEYFGYAWGLLGDGAVPRDTTTLIRQKQP
ncbi:hypothetical protein [Caldimonas brevitalea]|uniref:Chitinase n=1 Tax=Caldimonas brevitalea TaxID=413882 RepID=A0A0G3BG65_9BURK|nr:hypothetical protein [Caldimonas brevitalea]AKJ28292.1 hypothetical protein AAW51_1601 [Caldimonas brevitalea]